MQRDEAFMGEIVKQCVGQKIDMKMNDVEFIGATPDLPQHGERAADMITDAGQSQALRRAGDKLRGGARFSAREQSHLMTLADKLFGEP